MDKDTELELDNIDTKGEEVAESLKVALQKERDEKKALKERLAALEKEKLDGPQREELKAEPKKEEQVDVKALVTETVKAESFTQEVKRNVLTLAQNEEEASKMQSFLNAYKGEESDALRLAKMAKAAVNADSFIGDVGAMAQSTGMLSQKGTGARPAPSESEIVITEEQYQHMRALGYKDRESMKAAIKKFEEYQNR